MPEAACAKALFHFRSLKRTSLEESGALGQLESGKLLHSKSSFCAGTASQDLARRCHTTVRPRNASCLTMEEQVTRDVMRTKFC